VLPGWDHETCSSETNWEIILVEGVEAIKICPIDTEAGVPLTQVQMDPPSQRTGWAGTGIRVPPQQQRRHLTQIRRYLPVGGGAM
jgi:hypothetical protein